MEVLDLCGGMRSMSTLAFYCFCGQLWVIKVHLNYNFPLKENCLAILGQIVYSVSSLVKQ